MTPTSPSKEDLAAYRAALGAAYAALDEAKTDIDLALDDVQAARDEARSLYGTPEATSVFSNAIADIHLAARAIADAIDGLPALDEGDVEEEGE
jgi:hypothetical protein